MLRELDTDKERTYGYKKLHPRASVEMQEHRLEKGELTGADSPGPEEGKAQTRHTQGSKYNPVPTTDVSLT